MQYEPPIIPSYVTPSQRRFLRAYSELPGNISDAARRAHIPRRTVYNWLSNDRLFKTALGDIKNTADDFVMSKLFEQIDKGSTRAIIYYLKTYAKNRGYG